MKELGQRVWIGGVGICVLIVALILIEQNWFPPIIAVALAVLACIGYGEWCQLARAKQLAPSVVVGMVAAWLYIGVRYVAMYDVVRQGMPLGIAEAAVLFLAGIGFLVHVFMQQQQVLASLSASVFGLIYIVVPLSLVIDILYYLPRQIAIDGRWWLIFILGVTVFTDMGAYFTGRLIGKRRLAPRISPGKSVEGTVGGICVGVIAGIVIWLFRREEACWWSVLILALLLAVIGQVGDLLESLFKRDAGVKDSNRLPGLGGVLDIVDSLLLNIPFTYIILRWTAEVIS